MNIFLEVLLKVSFLILNLLGVLALSLGVILFLYPNVLIQILRWGSIATLVIGGAVLVAASICGLLTVRADVKENL